MHVQQKPPWGADALDAGKTLFAAAPDDDANLLEVAWTESGRGIRMRYAEGATFWISASLDEIWLTYDPPLTAADAAHFLLEPVLAFVLRRRGVLVWHASAVAFDGNAVVFCGAAGAGKSTAAGMCVAAGGAFISDDVVAVEDYGGTFHAHRGTAAIRAWDDGARVLAGDPERAPRFSATWDKRVLTPALLGGREARGPVPIALVCVLAERSSADGAPRLTPIVGQAAVRALLPHTAANSLLDRGQRAQELPQLAGFISRVPVANLVAHTDKARMPGLVDVIRRQLSG